MTMDLENLKGTLRARAEADTDAEELLARIGPARRRRRARRAIGAMAAVLALTGLVAVLVPRLPLGGYAVPGAPSAANPNPDSAAIGADPQTIHFGVGRFPYPVRTTTWAVLDGVERLSLWGNTVTFDDPQAHDDTEFFADLTLTPVTTSPTPNPTALPGTLQQPHSSPATVGGQPALVVTGKEPNSTLGATRITWQPMAGARAELSVRGPVPVDKALAFAGTLRLDVIHRCNLLVRTTALPDGAHVTGCSTMADSLRGDLTIRGPQGTISISVSAVAVFDRGATAGVGDAPQLPTLANGWPYEELDPSANTQHFTAYIRIPNPYLVVWAQGGFGLNDVLLVAGGLELSSR
ncbi:hypothetical protein Drose_01710 [Dactylosporangium roseum]|uniref:Uncharacterized protein n=1 Tax=Dactylosporangium roseum TaxID=47989 RepID=A0ABY5Z661_9ACTN|nr:hypothetical protein [Dactylosporangium roseum]UWZ37066.1 hypothetical protein Drose_01710 [Dactylosporangium roseum]